MKPETQKTIVEALAALSGILGLFPNPWTQLASKVLAVAVPVVAQHDLSKPQV